MHKCKPDILLKCTKESRFLYGEQFGKPVKSRGRKNFAKNEIFALGCVEMKFAGGLRGANGGQTWKMRKMWALLRLMTQKNHKNENKLCKI